MTHICVNKLSYHWFKQWFGACLRPTGIQINVGVSLNKLLETKLNDIWIKSYFFLTRKCIWKYRLKNVCHFVNVLTSFTKRFIWGQWTNSSACARQKWHNFIVNFANFPTVVDSSLTVISGLWWFGRTRDHNSWVFDKAITGSWCFSFIRVFSTLLVPYVEGILPKGPYLPCVSMAHRVLLAGYPRCVEDPPIFVRFDIKNLFWPLNLHCKKNMSRWWDNLIFTMGFHIMARQLYSYWNGSLHGILLIKCQKCGYLFHKF